MRRWSGYLLHIKVNFAAPLHLTFKQQSLRQDTARSTGIASSINTRRNTLLQRRLPYAALVSDQGPSYPLNHSGWYQWSYHGVHTLNSGGNTDWVPELITDSDNNHEPTMASACTRSQRDRSFSTAIRALFKGSSPSTRRASIRCANRDARPAASRCCLTCWMRRFD